MSYFGAYTTWVTVAWRLTLWYGDMALFLSAALKCLRLNYYNTCNNAVFNFIAVTVVTTGQTPSLQLLKQEIQRDSQELKVGGEGNETCLHGAGWKLGHLSILSPTFRARCCR